MKDKERALLLDKLDQITENPYQAVLVAAKRARSINTERLAKMQMLTEDSEDIIDYRKVTTQALEDLMGRKVNFHYKR